MSWRDNLRSASFRGVPFKVLDSTTEVGRRNVVHQYPFRDEPYIEDLGKDADSFNITGYVIANIDNNQDYFNERNALITALQESGPGTLVHPWIGELSVSLVGKASISESFNEGGIARFSMAFVQSKENKFPGQTTNNVNKIDNETEDAITSITDGFGANHVLTGYPSFVKDESVNNFNELTSMMEKSMFRIKGTNLTNYAKQSLRNVASNAVSTITSPCAFANSIIDAFGSILSLVGLAGAISSLAGSIIGICSGVSLSANQTISEIASGDEAINELLGVSTVNSLLDMTDYGNYI